MIVLSSAVIDKPSLDFQTPQNRLLSVEVSHFVPLGTRRLARRAILGSLPRTTRKNVPWKTPSDVDIELSRLSIRMSSSKYLYETDI
jgi:hypothetical protein